jgi:lactoylglutathione lyase
MGDQFLALSEGRRQGPDDDRHFGLVVDDREAVSDALHAAGIRPERGRGLQVRDPWGNVVEIVDYREIQFSKAPGVLEGMGLAGLEKTEAAQRELAEKGLTRPTAGSPPPSRRRP